MITAAMIIKTEKKKRENFCRVGQLVLASPKLRQHFTFLMKHRKAEIGLARLSHSILCAYLLH